jgi:hypothetical protein
VAPGWISGLPAWCWHRAGGDAGGLRGVWGRLGAGRPGISSAGRTPAGRIPVVTFYFDEATATGTHRCEVIAPCFAAWLERWIASGFSTFWFLAR